MNTYVSHRRRLPPPPPRSAAVHAPVFEEEDLSGYLNSDEEEPIGFVVEDEDSLWDGASDGPALEEDELLVDEPEDCAGNADYAFPLARVHTDSRPIHAKSVVTLMQTIDVFGVICPVTVDSRNRIITGAHRWAACTLLRTPADERSQVWLEITGKAMPESELRNAMALPYQPDVYLPCIAQNFDAEAYPAYAFELEVTENQHRRKYSKSEIRDLVQRLRNAGYTSQRGRPARGAKPLGKCLELFGITGAMAAYALQVDGAEITPKSGILTSTLRKNIETLRKTCAKLEVEELRLRAALHLDKLLEVLEAIEASPS